MDQCDLFDSFDEDVAADLIKEFENCLSAGQNSDSININIPNSNSVFTSMEAPPKQSSDFQTDYHRANSSSSSPIILNFGTNANSTENSQQAVIKASRALNHDDQEQSQRAQATKKTSRVRPPSQTYDHIIAERRRREHLSQLFIALSTIVPGLKKMDKTSVLGDAIKYLKHLQERVKTLEEQVTKQTMESAVLVKKSQITAGDEGYSNEKIESSGEQSLPEIEARICNNNILLKVLCEKQKGVLLNLLSKVEKLNLAVVNTNVTTFGNLSLDVTIIAEMEKDFNLTMKEVVKGLLAALQSTA
ncbi:hypothetical protein BUALT_Bualt11G0063700 [Buddleja alternifolia]|uniref:BHLH domain-containing protein n=1 Tax=Buddleja alternifolia TaxID=168488 RepID=A0AAV6WUQ2_9LAMI|nr:hypothetical protein BUALT_Bualt11G0063700 [Buddleja alternifolia]